MRARSPLLAQSRTCQSLSAMSAIGVKRTSIGLTTAPQSVDFMLTRPARASAKVVPGERIELPTRGLQNRCSTTELTRQTSIYWHFRGGSLLA
jgi:hypothetical protein